MSICVTDSTNVGQNFATLLDLIEYRANNQSEQTAYTFLQDGEIVTGTLTYRELARRSRAIAAQLQSLNAVGSRALLLYPPGLEFIAAFFGCLYGGMVAVPAYPPRRNQNLSRLQAIAASSQAAIALTTTSIMGDIEKHFAQEIELAKLHWLATDNIPDRLATSWQQPSVSSDTLAFLQYTSGSTGTPKGVMVSHGNLMHNSAAIQKCFADTPNSRGVSWLPPYHDMGLIGGIVQPLYVGAPMALMSPLAFLQQPYRWLQAISKFQATSSGGPDFAYNLCIRKITPEQRANLDLSSWEVAFTGAEPVRAETLEQFTEMFAACGFRKTAFQPCYGMAETTLMVSGGGRTALPILYRVDAAALEKNRVVTARGDREGTRTLVGCGHGADLKIAIVDPESLKSCAERQVGEIWVSGSSVAQGYWNRAEETKQTFHAYLADLSVSKDPECNYTRYLRTGDLGFLLDGELFVTGRIKDLMIFRGQNHYPQDIELTVEKSHSALRPNCGAAFTVEAKSEERLVIVQEIERSYLRKLNVKEVVGNISQAVAAEHGLQVYTTVLVRTGSIPRTSSGKIQRYACRSQYLAGKLNVIEDWSENPQGKTKFLHLKAEVESLLQELLPSKQS